MNITQIVDKIVKEADVNPAEYLVADRIDDINEKYLETIELAVQIASTEPISGDEIVSEEFTVALGSNEFLRTIKNIFLFRVDFKAEGSNLWTRVERDQSRKIGRSFCGCGIRVFVDEKRVFVEEGKVGTIRVTYARGDITTFVLSDYDAYDPPSPDWLPEVFHPILWLAPALAQAEYYKKDRVQYLRDRLARLETLFYNHYSRNAIQNSRFETGNENGNYR